MEWLLSINIPSLSGLVGQLDTLKLVRSFTVLVLLGFNATRVLYSIDGLNLSAM